MNRKQMKEVEKISKAMKNYNRVSDVLQDNRDKLGDFIFIVSPDCDYKVLGKIPPVLCSTAFDDKEKELKVIAGFIFALAADGGVNSGVLMEKISQHLIHIEKNQNIRMEI